MYFINFYLYKLFEAKTNGYYNNSVNTYKIYPLITIIQYKYL